LDVVLKAAQQTIHQPRIAAKSSCSALRHADLS
jgi:hypothetical protein